MGASYHSLKEFATSLSSFRGLFADGTRFEQFGLESHFGFGLGLNLCQFKKFLKGRGEKFEVVKGRIWRRSAVISFLVGRRKICFSFFGNLVKYFLRYMGDLIDNTEVFENYLTKLVHFEIITCKY